MTKSSQPFSCVEADVSALQRQLQQATSSLASVQNQRRNSEDFNDTLQQLLGGFINDVEQ